MAAESRPSVFEHRFLCSIGGIWLEHCLSSPEVKPKSPDASVQPLGQALNHRRLRWLGRVFRIIAECVFRCTLVGVWVEVASQ